MSFEDIKNVWCDFILNEGIMPSQITRKFKNAMQTGAVDKNYGKIATILIDRKLPEEGIGEDVFNSDADLVEWLDKVHPILQIIKSGAGFQDDSLLDMNDITKGAMISFIKSCPFVNEDIKNEYLRHLNAEKAKRVNDKLKRIKSGKKADFENYLLNKYSLATVNGYKTAVNTVEKLIGINVWNIDSPREVEKLFNELQKNDEFLERDYKGNAMFSNGIKRYIEFLRHMIEENQQ